MFHNRYKGHSGSFLLGTMAIAIGVAFLLKSFGYIPNTNVYDYWPLLLIALGVSRLLYPHSSRSYFWGPVFAIIGGVLLAKNLHYINFEIQKLWPVIPILFGIRLLLHPFSKPRYAPYIEKNHNHRVRRWVKDELNLSDDEISISLLLGGGEYQCTSQQFKGGNISLTLAGCELDLRNVQVIQNVIYLDVKLLMGGIEMRIPENWSVVYEGISSLGSVEDKTSSVQSPEKKLIIRGSITLAGIEVSN